MGFGEDDYGRSDGDRYDTVDVRDLFLVTETDAAYGFRRDRKNIFNVEVWIPKSQIDDPDELEDAKRGDRVNIAIPRWLAEEKDLAYEG